ncbi:hypothetical protein [Micromonospora sp. NPDC023956]|uniref:hypothetical protein n=1 Tax=Micromonospora sp. NPDC023956 TaxID=3155722 RepID=UPI0033C79E43
MPSRSTPSVAAQPADGPGAGGTPTGSPARGEPADRYPTDAYPADRHPTDAYPADPYPIDPGPAVSGVDAERRPWNPPTEPERPSWAGGGWAPPWSREQGGGRRSRAERHREDDEPTGRRPREERPREDVPPAWTPPPAAREPEPRRLADPARLPSTDPAVARTPAPEPDAGRAPRPEPGSGRTPPAEPAAARTPTTEPTPYRAAETGDPRVPSAEPGAPYRVAGRRSPEPESEPRRPYPPMDQTSWASARPSAVPSSAPPVPSPVDPTDPSGARPETRTLRPFRLRPEAAEADHPPSVGRHPDRPGAGPLAAPATGGTGRSDSFPPAPAPASAPPYTARRSAPDPVSPAPSTVADRHPAGTPAVLPQRVPAEPDVPVVPEPPAVEPPAQTPELARIATHLRREDEPAPPQERPEGFDVNAILDAVRGVAGVHDASLRRTAAGAHSLRLDLADGADAAEVSRMVARLLQERMGLAAAPHLPGPAPVPDPPVRRRMAPPPENRAELPADVRRRRQQPGTPRGRASVEEQPTPWAAFGGAATGSPVAATGSPATLAASYSGGQRTTTETAPSRPLDTGGAPGPRVVIDHVQVSTFGLDADVEVRLLAGERNAAGRAVGPAVDGYVLRLCAVAAAAAVDELLRIAGSGRGRCFVEHAAVVPFGTCEVATVVVLLVCDGWVEQLAGSALVSGADPRQAVVRATLAAVNRRLEALLT